MKPVSDNVNNFENSKGCTPISAVCVKWEGPDIPCINLCKGDSIDKVVYDLAKILCEITEDILDVSTLDFGCLVEDGCDPKTLLETLQALINKVCEEDVVESVTVTEDGYILLPECLHYQNLDNDTVTQLLADDYVMYLADKICEILLSIASIDLAITNINTRIIELETIINNLNSQGPPTFNIVTQCLSGPSPGAPLDIGTAFTNLEEVLCDYIAVLGTATEWQVSLGNICIQHDTELPCEGENGETEYGDLPNWIAPVVTAADSVNNLWVALCAMNYCLNNSLSPANFICDDTYQPQNVVVTGGTSVGIVTWDPPLLPANYELFSAYEVKVFEAGTITEIWTSGPLQPSPTGNSVNIPHGQNPPWVVGNPYDVRVYAIYPCTPGVTLQDPYNADFAALESYGPSIGGIGGGWTEVLGASIVESTILAYLQIEPVVCTSQFNVECPAGSGTFVNDEYTVFRLYLTTTPDPNSTLAINSLAITFDIRLSTEICDLTQAPASAVTTGPNINIPMSLPDAACLQSDIPPCNPLLSGTACYAGPYNNNSQTYADYISVEHVECQPGGGVCSATLKDIVAIENIVWPMPSPTASFAIGESFVNNNILVI